MVTESFPPLGGAAVTDVATRLCLDFASTCCVHVSKMVDLTVSLRHRHAHHPPPPHRVCKHRALARHTSSGAGKPNSVCSYPNPVSSPRTCCHEDTGIGRCHRSAAGHRRRHTHPDTDRTTSKTYSSSKVLWAEGAPATSSCTGGGTHLPRCELPHN